ncbi:MAG: DNA polymerase III subunit gamma/tau [Gammaproteobacteria bacterium]|nr:DNA polymerase III subunit gamma/tau [Gammaproteobacteria bacterium]
MSYLVLARKWRPKNFEDVVGQDHVVRTLSHSLNNERLHHAYLFTGTRGVGKTTIARILAKALNCEQGVSSKPCGQCNACVEVDQGSYIDLIEVDAASKTKVEDTRALLDNVPYLPTSGRYKIYLFDEIHMLSGHSFNAFLKTLEEPPEHVKFLMATTDPQKLPVTVLSRCIQFNLRAMDNEEIVDQLEKIIPDENVMFEPAAINAIARLSQGSMRDALSIVDQAISYTQSNLNEAAVRDMLGMLSHDFIYSILYAVANRNTEELFRVVEQMFERSINIESALDDLLLKLHDLGLHKVAPKLVESRTDNVEQLRELADVMTEEEIQLYYQIGLLGKRDLKLAPTARIGLEMTLLRMIAFHPDSQSEGKTADESSPVGGKANLNTTQGAQSQPTQTAPAATPNQTGEIQSTEDWCHFASTAPNLNGMAKQFANQVSFASREGNKIVLIAPPKASSAIMRSSNLETVEKVISEYIGQKVVLKVRQEVTEIATPDEVAAKQRKEIENSAIERIKQEEIPKMLQQEFGAIPDPKSIQLPIDNPK